MAALCRKFKVGIELIQVKTNLKGRKLSVEGAGEVIGTPEAISAEIRSVIEMNRGKQGAALRQRMIALGDQLRKSRENGSSKRAMERFGTICDEMGIPA